MAKDSSVHVSPSQGSQLRVNTGIMRTLSAGQVKVLTLLVYPLI